ncbi:DUF4402 domain-containing protein [Desulfobulbus alkaliphilus]|uniref:DUF4402 domain-containing protein n=1 Tax=Desulfobulbus alkaliphilus TaxID=869814 RepID=UPI001965F5F1|nr:DUF4402 domain-containing protein [Desulfobulbus alkaliphilus]MBM9537095.1 DUF4402 domain-containing protein [Desulfobulbus alkaliphilus]
MKKKLWTGSALFVGAAMLGALALSGAKVEAASHDVEVEATITTTLVETVVRGINFGTIDLVPGKTETVVMDASSLSSIASTGIDNTSAKTVPGGSTVSAFTYDTGLISVAAAFELNNVEVVYPVAPQDLIGQVTGNILTITDMANNSWGGAGTTLHKGATETLYIHMGGQLNIPANSPNDTYVGTVQVTINYL